MGTRETRHPPALHEFACRNWGWYRAHGEIPRVCRVLMWHGQMGSHFVQEVDFCIAPYFFSLLGTGGMFARCAPGARPARYLSINYPDFNPRFTL